MLEMIGRKVLRMTIREFLLNDTIFNLDEIRIDTLDSDDNHLVLFDGPWYSDAGLDYLDCFVLTFYHNFDSNFTVFVVE